MRVRGCHSKLSEPVSCCNDPEVVVYKILIAPCDPVFYHEPVVSQRLYLHVIIERSYPVEFIVISSSDYGLIQLSGFTCGAEYEPFSVSLQHRARYPRTLVEIIYVRSADKLVYVFEARLVFREDYYVVRPVLLYINGAVRCCRILIRIQIPFNTVYHFYISSVLGLLRSLLGRVRECLHHTVISDGNSRLAPVSGLFYDVFHLVEAVVVAHLGMTVQLDPAAVRIGVLLEFFLDFLYRVQHHEILVLIGVVLYASAGSYHIARRQVLLYLLELFFGNERLETESPYFGCDKYGYQLAAALDRHGLHAEDLTLDHRLLLAAYITVKFSVNDRVSREVISKQHKFAVCIRKCRLVFFVLPVLASVSAVISAVSGSLERHALLARRLLRDHNSRICIVEPYSLS